MYGKREIIHPILGYLIYTWIKYSTLRIEINEVFFLNIKCKTIQRNSLHHMVKKIVIPEENFLWQIDFAFALKPEMSLRN